MAKSKATKVPERESITIEIPTRETDGYICNRIDVRLSVREAIAYRRVFDGLAGHESALPARQPDALRWILNRVYEELYGDRNPLTLSD